MAELISHVLKQLVPSVQCLFAYKRDCKGGGMKFMGVLKLALSRHRRSINADPFQVPAEVSQYKMKMYPAVNHSAMCYYLAR